MKILLVGNYLPDAQESMARFVDLLWRSLAARGHDVRVIRPRPVLHRVSRFTPGLVKWLGYWDKLIAFPPVLRREAAWADVVHVIDHSNAVYTSQLRRVPHVVTCHDMCAIRSAMGHFPENPTAWTGRVYQDLILKGLVRAKSIACVSESTREDLLRWTRFPADRVTVVYNGPNYDYRPVGVAGDRLGALGIRPGVPFVLHVGGNQWYKNRAGALSVFRRLRALAPDLPTLSLVMAGKPLAASMRRFVDEHNLGAFVLQRESVSNDDLRALYSSASAFLFPSHREGFGWPVAEAQACGCPVVCGDGGALAEVAGDGALTAPTSDEEALARLLNRVIRPSEFRSTLIDRGFRNAGRFDGEVMTSSYETIYRGLCRPVGAPSPLPA